MGRVKKLTRALLFEPVFDAKSVFPQCREDDFPFQQLSSNIVSHFIFRQKSM